MQSFDIDIDLADRNTLLEHIQYTDAVLLDGRRHPSGIYVTAVPQNPITGHCSLDYKKAEDLGYFKLDILNQSIYKMVKSPEHLEELLSKPMNWSRLLDKNFVEKLVHIGNYADLIRRLPEPITCIEHLAMFLATIRPGKKHLQGKTWKEVEETIWDRDSTAAYSFRKSHSLAYALLIMLHCALLEEQKL